jgi:hypothetical protein
LFTELTKFTLQNTFDLWLQRAKEGGRGPDLEIPEQEQMSFVFMIVFPEHIEENLELHWWRKLEQTWNLHDYKSKRPKMPSCQNKSRKEV